MSRLEIERIGGLAGFGGPTARIRSHGTLSLDDMSPGDRSEVDALFARGSARNIVADGFRYRITRTTQSGTETIEIPEADVPDKIRASVRDELL